MALKTPSNILISGPSQAGKTRFLLNMLKEKKTVFDPPPDRIIYCFSEWQTAFEDFPEIEFHEGLPETMWTFNPKRNNLLIVDDLMNSASGSDILSDLFTKVGHHKRVTTILIVQNLFFQGKRSRNISLNSHYIVLFKSPRDMGQILCLAKQMYPNQSKLLLDSYKLATSRERGYLLLDCRVDTRDDLRLRSCILSFEHPELVYIKT